MMKFDRLLAGAAVATLMASTAFAQTGSRASSTATPSAAGQMQGGAASSPMTPSTEPQGVMAPDAGASAAPAASAAIIAPSSTSSILAELKAANQFTTLLSLVDASGLTSLLQSQPNLTVIAPTDAAFAALPPGQVDALKKDPTQLRALLTYHLIATKVTEAQVKGHSAGKVMTAAQKEVTIDGVASPIKINDANVIQAGVMASNGVIYVVDKVLTPTT